MTTNDSITSEHTLPGYQMLDQIGQGGMSTVYRARHDALNRTVAIKFLTAELSHNLEDREAFKFETQAAARINHPNIVQLFDAGELSNRPYYIMEYVSGANLGELINMRGKMEEEDALLIAEKIAEALRHCWLEHRLIHCDVKPENIIIDMHGKVKLTDLGLARIDGLATEKNDSEYTVGTPAYMSPEQAMGGTDLDPRTDIYALGALLYHMVTGYRLFDGESDTETAQSQVSYAVEDVMDVNTSISPSLAWMIERMLLKDRDQRYASWEEVLTDIQTTKRKNMIKGGAFDPNYSTMARSEKRTVPPASTTPAPDFNTTAQPSLTANTPPIVIPSNQRKLKVSREKITEQHSSYKLGNYNKRKEYDTGKAFMAMLSIAAIAIVLYGLTYGKLQLDLNTNAQANPATTPQKTTASTTPATTPAATPKNNNASNDSSDDFFSDDFESNDTPAEPAKQTASSKASNPEKNLAKANAFFDEITGETPTTPADPFANDLNVQTTPHADTTDAPTWNNPSFIKATKALATSQQRYEDYLQNKGNPKVLDSIEKNCQAAIKIFTTLKGKAPQEIDLESYSKKAYTLLTNCQWTKQLL